MAVLSPKQFEQQYNAAIEAGVSHSRAIKDISNATINSNVRSNENKAASAKQTEAASQRALDAIRPQLNFPQYETVEQTRVALQGFEEKNRGLVNDPLSEVLYEGDVKKYTDQINLLSKFESGELGADFFGRGLDENSLAGQMQKDKTATEQRRAAQQYEAEVSQRISDELSTKGAMNEKFGRTAPTEQQEQPKEEQNGFDRIMNLISGIGKGNAAAATGGQRLLYELGQGARSQINEEAYAQAKADYDRALQAYEEELAAWGEQGAQSAYYVLQDAKRKLDAFGTVVEDEVQQKATQAASTLSQELNRQSGEDIAKAKEGLGTVGRIAVDTGAALGDILIDAASGMGALNMAGRVFGKSAIEAEAAGANTAQQLAYGTATAAFATGLNKVIDGLAGVYGKGFGDDAAEAFIAKIASTDKGRNVARAILNIGGEGAEEFTEGAVEPLLKLIYDGGDAIKAVYSSPEAWSEALLDNLYSAAIGSVIGAGGQVVDVARGGYRAKNAATPLQPSDYTAPKTGLKPTSPQSAPTATSYVDTVAEILSSGRVNNTQATAIVAEPIFSQAFYELTGIRLDGMTTENARKAVQDEARNRAYNAQQSEQLARQAAAEAEAEQIAANLQRAEEAAAQAQAQLEAAQETAVRNSGFASYVRGLYLDGMTPAKAAEIFRNPELKAAWENMTGLTLPESRNNAVSTIINTPLTEIALPDPFTVNAAQSAQESTGGTQIPPSTQTASTNAPDVLNSNIQPQSPIDIVMEVATGQKNTAPTQGADSAADILVQMATGQYVPTQTNSSDPLYTAAERGIDGLNPESSMHVLRSDATVDAEAEQRYAADRAGEQQRLFESGQTWTDTDTALAHRLMEDAINEARRTGDYSTVVKMQREWERQGTAEGQALRQRGRFIDTPEAVIAEAAALVYDDAATRKLNPKQKAGIMETVVKFAQAYNAVPQGDTAAIIDLIKQASETRRTTGLFRTKTSNPIAWALEQAATMPDGDTFLRDVLITQIRNIAGDYARPSVLEQAKQVRYLNMLSKISTVARNLVANNILDPMEQFANNQAVPLDMLLSKFTGTRSIAVDRGAFSAEKWSGKTEGFIKSYIQVALDADIEDVNSKYEQRSGRTFKMTGNILERFLSTWEKYENYALKTTDETKKGGIRAEAQRGIDALLEAGKIAPGALADQAERIALDRTLQKDGVAAKALSGVRSALDVIGIKDKQGGTMGLGSNIAPFARVPANALVKSFQFTPGGLVESVGRLAQILKAAADGTLTAQQQADFVNSVGRTMTGIELTSLAVAAALKGIITVAGSDDKDREASEKADGLSGTQLNLSALGRWLSGEDTTRKDGDTLIEVGFAEQLNATLAMGAAIADAYEAEGDINAGDIANANIEAVLQSVLELPALAQFSDMINAYNYSKAETTGGKAADALGGLATNILTSYAIPNAIRGVASSSDVVARDMYTADTQIGKALDYAKAGIPGVRQTLPVAVDGWGDDKSNTTGNRFLDVLNNNILPGRVTQYRTDETRDALAYLSDLGINGIYPDRNAPSSVQINGEKILLDAAAKRDYQQTAGQLTEQYYSDLIKSPLFDNMSTELQEETLKDIKSMAEAQAAKDFKASQGVKGKDLKTNWDTALLLNDPATYLAILAQAKNAQDRKGGTFSSDSADTFKLLIAAGTNNNDLNILAGNLSESQQKIYSGLSSALGQDKANEVYKAVETTNEYGGQNSDAIKAIQIAQVPAVNDFDTFMKTLEAYSPPNSETGKRSATVRRYEAANKQGISYKDWTDVLAQVEKYDNEQDGDTGVYWNDFVGVFGKQQASPLYNIYNKPDGYAIDTHDEEAIEPAKPKTKSKAYRFSPNDIYTILGLG